MSFKMFNSYFQYVLNVTPDLPNTFEADGCGINYLKIPIADHWSQNLAVHFPQAIRFIGAYCQHFYTTLFFQDGLSMVFPNKKITK